MQRISLFFVCFFVAAAFARIGDAQAKAIYAWVPDDRGGCCRGTLEISDEAYFAGVAAAQHGKPALPLAVERFFFEGRFTVLDELKRNPENPTMLVTVSTGLAAQPEAERCCEWDIEVRVTDAGLEGHARLKTKSDEVRMSGTSDQWGLDLARSDVIPSGVVCGIAPKARCSSATGRWVLVSAPVAKN